MTIWSDMLDDIFASEIAKLASFTAGSGGTAFDILVLGEIW